LAVSPVINVHVATSAYRNPAWVGELPVAAAAGTKLCEVFPGGIELLDAAAQGIRNVEVPARVESKVRWAAKLSISGAATYTSFAGGGAGL